MSATPPLDCTFRLPTGSLPVPDRAGTDTGLTAGRAFR